jgi:two-component system, LytTR family, sensor histidine kinase AgrC
MFICSNLIFLLILYYLFDWNKRYFFLSLFVIGIGISLFSYYLHPLFSLIGHFILLAIYLSSFSPDQLKKRLFMIGILACSYTGLFLFSTLFNETTVSIIVYHLIILCLFIMKGFARGQLTFLYSTLFIVLLIMNGIIGFMYLPLNISLVFSLMLYLIADHNRNYLRNTYEQEMSLYQVKMIQKHVEEVEHIYETMRGWRHDFHNHLQTLKAQLSIKRTDLMEAYLNELEQDLNTIHTLVQSNNTNLDAILNSKLSLAKSKAIHITIKASVPSDLSIADIDLCVIIGNLLDNAIESCDTMKDETDKFIRVYMGLLKQQLYISVTNSTKEVIRKLDHEYITTKRGNHGHGLKRIDQVVNKYDGYVNRKNEPGVFVTEILIPL